jgi:hypothetical protein
MRQKRPTVRQKRPTICGNYRHTGDFPDVSLSVRERERELHQENPERDRRGGRPDWLASTQFVPSSWQSWYQLVTWQGSRTEGACALCTVLKVHTRPRLAYPLRCRDYWIEYQSLKAETAYHHPVHQVPWALYVTHLKQFNETAVVDILYNILLLLLLYDILYM